MKMNIIYVLLFVLLTVHSSGINSAAHYPKKETSESGSKSKFAGKKLKNPNILLRNPIIAMIEKKIDSDLINDLKSALDAGANVNVTCNGKPLLMIAIDSLSVGGGELTDQLIEEIVELLLQKGANVNVNDTHGHTPLTLAACGGNANIVRQLIKYGANVNQRAVTKVNNMTPLIFAAISSNLEASEVVEELLIKGAKINLRDINDNTALLHAINENHYDIIEILLKYGANPNAVDDVTLYNIVADFNDHVSKDTTPIDSPTHLKNVIEPIYLEIVDMLLKYNARPDENFCKLIFSPGYENFLKIYLNFLKHPLFSFKNANKTKEKCEIKYKLKLDNKDTFLLKSIFMAHPGMVRKAIANGANVNAVDMWGCSVLMNAVIWLSKVKVKPEIINEIFDILLINKADTNYVDRRGETVLHVAINANNIYIIKKLLEYNIDLNELNNNITPLMNASYAGHKEIVELLLQSGAKVNIKNDEGNTALTYAASQARSTMIKILLDHGASPNILNNHGESALFFVVANGSRAIDRKLPEKRLIVRMLLEKIREAVTRDEMFLKIIREPNNKYALEEYEVFYKDLVMQKVKELAEVNRFSADVLNHVFKIYLDPF